MGPRVVSRPWTVTAISSDCIFNLQSHAYSVEWTTILVLVFLTFWCAHRSNFGFQVVGVRDFSASAPSLSAPRQVSFPCIMPLYTTNPHNELGGLSNNIIQQR